MNALMKRRLQAAIPSQADVAKVLGIAPSAVSKWECGRGKPRLEKLPTIAKLYGCTVEDLLRDLGGYADGEGLET